MLQSLNYILLFKFYDMNSKGGIIKLNLIFWSLLFLYKWIGVGSLTDEYEKYFVYAIFHIPVAFLTAMLSFHLVFEKFYTNKNKSIFLLLPKERMAIFTLIPFISMTKQRENLFFRQPSFCLNSLVYI
jgi:hypothetical protein